MSGVIATLPKFQFSANGVPMVGGTLDTYIAGTTTPTSTWQDSALSIANTNPIVLDARGECVLWLDSAVVYKFVLKSSPANGGVVQWTQDNISNPAALSNTLRTDLAASSGASLVGGGDQVVASITALRALLKTSASKNAHVVSYYGSGGTGGGDFWYDAADTTTADNGGTVIVATDGGRWKRPDIGSIHVDWFGAKTGDATAAATNYTAIRAALAAAITHATVRLEGQRQINYSSGEYFITGNSPLCFNHTEMLALPGAYRYRRGLKHQGTGKMSTILTQVTAGAGELWFYSTYDAAFPADSSVMDYMQFDGITFRGTDANNTQATAYKTNGFDWQTYGWEKFVTFSNCMFERLDKAFKISGYGNADHNRWTNCHFRAIRDYVFSFDNNQSVANTFTGCDMEEIRGYCFLIGPTGGGDIHWTGGSVVLYPEVDGAGAVVAGQAQKGFVIWDNSGTSSGASSGPGNNKYTFEQLRFETYHEKQAIVFSFRTGADIYGSVDVTFSDCSFAHPHDYVTSVVTTIPYPAVDLENTITVRFNRSVIKYPYTFKVSENAGEIYFDDCEYIPESPISDTNLLAGKCTVLGVGSVIQCRGLKAPQLKTNGDYANLISPDFTKKITGRITRVALTQAKHPLTPWPQLTRSANVVIYVPAGSLINSVGIEKPVGSLGSPNADYGLSLGGSGSEVLLAYAGGDENRAIYARSYLTTPYKVPASPNNYVVLAAGGSASAATFASTDGAVYLEYV